MAPATAADRFPEFADESDAALRRKIELAAEDVVVAYETAHGRECERVGHLKIGFDIRSLSAPDSQTGYRDPVTGVRRIEVKGRKLGQAVRLTTNEWFGNYIIVTQSQRESGFRSPGCLPRPRTAFALGSQTGFRSI